MIPIPETDISLDEAHEDQNNDVDPNIETNLNDTINSNELALVLANSEAIQTTHTQVDMQIDD